MLFERLWNWQLIRVICGSVIDGHPGSPIRGYGGRHLDLPPISILAGTQQLRGYSLRRNIIFRVLDTWTAE